MSSGSSEGELVFVYGNLCRDAPEAARVAGAQRVARGWSEGHLYAIASYPAFIREQDDGWIVHGDLLRVSEELLAELDSYHGVERYRRVRRTILVRGFEDKRHEAWLWEWVGPKEGAVPVVSGDWMDAVHPPPAPLLTWVGIACGAVFPLLSVVGGGMATLSIPVSAWVWGAIAAAAIGAPFAGFHAIHLADKRRERARTLRILARSFLGLQLVPVGIALVLVIFGAIAKFF